MPDPFRVEFWGDEIDTISTFKTDTQRRVDTVKRVDITRRPRWWRTALSGW